MAGDEVFWELTEAYLLARPSRSFTLRHLGETFADFIEVSPLLDKIRRRWFGSVARIKYAFMECFESAQGALPETEDYVKLLHLPVPADLCWDWLDFSPATSQDSQPIDLAVWREPSGRSRQERIETAEVPLLLRLKDGIRLDALFDSLPEPAPTEEEITRWFGKWHSHRWLGGHGPDEFAGGVDGVTATAGKAESRLAARCRACFPSRPYLLKFMANKDVTDPARMEKIVSLCKRRGFIFQAGEIYGGLNGCWDYGPLGAELKRNLKDYWWRKTVQERDDVLGMDGAILTMEQVLVASGHAGGFADPMCDCRVTQSRFRADQLPALSGEVWTFYGALPTSMAFEVSRENGTALPDKIAKNLCGALAHEFEEPATISDVSIGVEAVVREGAQIDESKVAEISKNVRSKVILEHLKVLVLEGKTRKDAEKVAKQFYVNRKVENPMLITSTQSERVEDSTSFNPENGAELTEPRQFNLMLQTNFGATGDQIAYLRPETAQSIFCQYKNILDSNRVKLPFGIAQCGKSFRNEINPRNYIFRSREFEQMEIEYFCHPDDGLRLTDEWLAERLKFYGEIGIPREKLHILDIPDGERAFYSKKTYDIEYEFPFGIQELEGVAYRTDYDLGVHEKGSGKSQLYFDEETKEKFLPHVVEPSAGCDRTVLALICEAFDEETLTDEKGKEDIRTMLRFVPRMAPIKVGIFPLLKKNEEQVAICREIQKTLQPWMNVFYDDGGALGRRYRRQDEVGTPFCVTVDFETLGEQGDELKGTVTIRHRDSMEQERLPISSLLAWLLERVR